MNHAMYLAVPIRAPEVLIDYVRDSIRRLGEVDALVGCGLSGAMAIPLVARELGLRMCIVRKDDDRGTHSASRFEGNMLDGDRWLFVDDLICSGATFYHTFSMMQNHDDTCGRYTFAGVSLYSQTMTSECDSEYVQDWLEVGKRNQ